jgi:hypothetical protein
MLYLLPLIGFGLRFESVTYRQAPPYKWTGKRSAWLRVPFDTNAFVRKEAQRWTNNFFVFGVPDAR